MPDGLCARCLLAFALEAEPAVPDDDAVASDKGTDATALLNRRIGRYQLLAEIDRGGVGIVYRARQADLKREVALKMLLPTRLESADAFSRFRREAELMAGLDHPGILPVYEVGEHKGLPYFSMKLAEGGNLAARIPALRGQHRESARLVAALARAIGYAHDRGVLHRDLKPSNIVFDAAGQCMVTDFGLARRLAADSSLTGIDALIGTPRYVAPEVLTTPGAQLTAAADVYGLGAIFYELLSGRAPFADLTPVQILQQIATRRPRPPRQLDAAIPAELEAICLRCLEKRPGDRYASAGALGQALENWVQRGKRATHWWRTSIRNSLPSRRRRAGVAASLLVVGGLVAAVAWYILREPIPVPDPVTATSSVVVLPLDAQKTVPAVREAARQLAAHLQLPSILHLLPFEETLNIFSSKDFPRNDVDASSTLGAFIVVEVVALDGEQQFALQARDDIREERLYETTFALSGVDIAARHLAETLAQRRQQPTAEAHLSRGALASLLRGKRLLQAPWEAGNTAAIDALRDAIDKAPDSALAHAWLAWAYYWYSGGLIWLDTAVDTAARAQRMDPTLGLAPTTLGFVYANRSWFSRAVAAYEQARALGSLSAESGFATAYYATGRFDESYRLCRERLRFAPDAPLTLGTAAHVLFAVGENDAGERALRVVMARQPKAEVRTLQEAEIAMYRHDSARCRDLAGSIEPETGDGAFDAFTVIRTCALQQGDFAAALAAVDANKRMYASGKIPIGNNPALREAILLAQLNQHDRVPALVKEARKGFQNAIDSNNEYPPVWLRMAAAQRLSGEIDAAYVTLEHAFALGLTVNNVNRWDAEFLPFVGDARL